MRFKVWRIQNRIIIEAYGITEEDTYDSTFDDIYWSNDEALEEDLLYIDSGHLELSNNLLYYPIYSTKDAITMYSYNVVTEASMEEKLEKVLNTLNRISSDVDIIENKPIIRNKGNKVEFLEVSSVNGCVISTVKFDTEADNYELAEQLSEEYNQVRIGGTNIMILENSTILPDLFSTVSRVFPSIGQSPNDMSEEMYDKQIELMLDLRKI